MGSYFGQWQNSTPSGPAGALKLTQDPASLGEQGQYAESTQEGAPKWGGPGKARNTTAQVGGSAASGAGGAGGAGTGGGMTWAAQANPYLDQVFKRYDDLMGKYNDLSTKSLSSEPAIQDYTRMRKQGWDEANAGAGRRGFGGDSTLAMKSNFTQGTEQGAQKIAAEWANNNLGFQKSLFDSMTGVLGGQQGAGSQIQAGQLGLVNAANDAARTQISYQTEMMKLPYQLLQAQLQAAQSAMAML